MENLEFTIIYNPSADCCLVCHISRCFAEQDDLLEFVGRLDNQVGAKSAGRDADLIMVCS